jgi:hypothetical protein
MAGVIAWTMTGVYHDRYAGHSGGDRPVKMGRGVVGVHDADLLASQPVRQSEERTGFKASLSQADDGYVGSRQFCRQFTGIFKAANRHSILRGVQRP